MIVTQLMACSPAPPEEELPLQVEPERCVLPEDGDPGGPARALALGQGEPDAFVSYQAGQPVQMVLGWQGGYMITPRVRVEAFEGDPEDACWLVRLTNDMADVEVLPGAAVQLRFQRHGDAFYSDAINNLLAYERDVLDGQSLAMDLTARGIGVDESISITVTLE